ncbi:MAG: deoxyguanosinetriphosphate triphosphohydrolase [Lachnospiraceae bacterium]|jgi:dGTPase
MEVTVREQTEEIENRILRPCACLSSQSRGRDQYEEQDDIRTCYQRDRDRILHCKAFRRMKHKTQVFLAPFGDHYRTRLTHTLEVAQIGRTIARALRLNEDLTEAIALGHDIGHTPFGHSGEKALNMALEGTGYTFHHYEQSVRLVETLENSGQGLNLTWEVRDGILNHGTAAHPHTLEGRVIQLSDKIAYINHDIDDAIRAKVLTEDSLPREYTDVLGYSVHDRLNNLVHDIIRTSAGLDWVNQSPDMAWAMQGLRQYLIDNLYTNPVVKGEDDKICGMICQLYDYYCAHYDHLPNENVEMIMSGKASKEQAVCDYIAGMTDQYAVTVYEKLFVPKSWPH